MSYPWTRVPSGAPPLDRVQLGLLPVADLFMALMWSRPGGLSLRTTWVTPATIWLGAGGALFGLPGGIATVTLGITAPSLLLVAIGMVASLLGLGAGTVALYGIRQRLLRRRGASTG